MTKFFGLFIATLFLAGCGEFVSSDRAIQAAQNQGFSDARVVETHTVAPTFYGCAESDAVAFEVTATNSQQARVRFTVCCGLILKGCTIRH